MAKEPTQKAKLALKALALAMTQAIKNDFYLQPKLQITGSSDTGDAILPE